MKRQKLVGLGVIRDIGFRKFCCDDDETVVVLNDDDDDDDDDDEIRQIGIEICLEISLRPISICSHTDPRTNTLTHQNTLKHETTGCFLFVLL